VAETSSPYDTYVKETGNDNVDDYLAYLLAHGVIDEEQYRKAHVLGNIELVVGSEAEGAERFITLGSIGEGSMGEVLLAKDRNLRRNVAIKVLKPSRMVDEMSRRFVREAQITAQLDHPNVVPVYEMGRRTKERPNPSFVMKLVQGHTLLDIVFSARSAYEVNPQEPPLDPGAALDDRLDYFLKVCDAISFAHSRRILHRDLKAENIMVGEFGEVYVMDWGLARPFDAPDEEVSEELEGLASEKGGLYVGRTQLGHVVGTPIYMPPEQAEGQNDLLDARTDLYSLGMILHELVTLRAPRVGDNVIEILEKARLGEIEPIVHVEPSVEVAPDLRAIIEKATRARQSQRYQRVNELSEDVRRFIRGDEVSVRPDNATRKLLRWMANHRQLTLSVVAGLVLLSIAVIGWSLYSRNAAALAAHERENRLIQIQGTVAERGHVIDRFFLRLEEGLIGLSEEAVYLLERAPANDELLYRLADFNDPSREPSDLVFSAPYGRRVSIDYPVVKLAPDVQWDAVEPLVQRLAPLRHHLRALLAGSRSSPESLSLLEERALLLSAVVPIRWAFVGLEAGVMYAYPGKGTYADEYDPRERPWYQLSAHRQGASWGNPYWDVQGQGLVLPCSVSLYGSAGDFYGVAGLDVTFSELIQTLLVPAGDGSVVETFLVDDEGRLIVRSGQTSQEDDAAADSSLELEDFPVPEVLAAMQTGRSGLLEVDRRLYVFAHITTLGWFYVEEIVNRPVHLPD
jgi:serine/threonine-protein kinase